MKIITPKIHAIIDFLLVMLMLISPRIFALSETASTLSYILGVVHFFLVIFTDFSGGIFKVIHLKLHGLIEFVISLALIILAFTYFKGNLIDEMYFACLGLLILIIFMLTDYKKALPII